MIWMGSVVPWLTFRGLHTDHLEVFSADHGLTFRGLPAEGLGVLPHEAASSSNLPADTIGGIDSSDRRASPRAHMGSPVIPMAESWRLFWVPSSSRIAVKVRPPLLRLVGCLEPSWGGLTNRLGSFLHPISSFHWALPASVHLLLVAVLGAKDQRECHYSLLDLDSRDLRPSISGLVFRAC